MNTEVLGLYEANDLILQTSIRHKLCHVSYQDKRYRWGNGHWEGAATVEERIVFQIVENRKCTIQQENLSGTF